MARNRLAGTKRGNSRTAKFYHNNPEANKKKLEYMKEYNKKPGRQKYRALLQAINRKNGTHGNLDDKDVSHISKEKTISEHQSKNRGNKKRIFFRPGKKRKRG